jgi:hypothetical protein
VGGPRSACSGRFPLGVGSGRCGRTRAREMDGLHAGMSERRAAKATVQNLEKTLDRLVEMVLHYFVSA